MGVYPEFPAAFVAKSADQYFDQFQSFVGAIGFFMVGCNRPGHQSVIAYLSGELWDFADARCLGLDIGRRSALRIVRY